MARRHNSGFTLIEILIVVIILGVLAAIALPLFAGTTDDARNSTFVTNLRSLSEQFRLYELRNGTWPTDATPGSTPSVMTTALEPFNFNSPTPIGGEWDWDYLQFGVTAGVSVHMPDRTPTQMIEIDKMIDDGDLSTGAFHSRSDGYIFVLVP